MERIQYIGVAVFAWMWAQSAMAEPPARPEIFQKLVQCKTMTDEKARLACYDNATEALNQAEKSGDVVVIERKEVEKAKVQAFGLALPRFDFLERGPKPVQINQVALTVASVSVDGNGKYQLTMTDGQVWRYLETYEGYAQPHPGSKVVIKRGLIGSFSLSIDGDTPAKATRVQ